MVSGQLWYHSPLAICKRERWLCNGMARHLPHMTYLGEDLKAVILACWNTYLFLMIMWNSFPLIWSSNFLDDISKLEKLNLIFVGLCSYNFKNQVASDIGINQKYLPSVHIQFQKYLDQIEQWTLSNKAKLNVAKSKVMIFNFTEDFQFSTRLYLENTLL